MKNEFLRMCKEETVASVNALFESLKSQLRAWHFRFHICEIAVSIVVHEAIRPDRHFMVSSVPSGKSWDNILK
jgi:hypothetical protein